MSEILGRFADLDLETGLAGLPLWFAGAAATLAALICLLVFIRASRCDTIGALERVMLVMIGAGVGWAVLHGTTGSDVAVERRALDARMHELLTRALVPGSALTCLDAVAGDTVETFCEQALFQTPEATAAAVSYVSAQLTLLAEFSAHTKRSGAGVPTALGNLRRAVEMDRFGLVARVLAVRDDCTPDACGAFALLNDASRIATNLKERTYDVAVGRHSAAWSPVAKSSAAAPAAPPGGAATPAAGLFFPSSASIPPVNIMDTEPPASAETGTAPVPGAKQAPTPTPPRRPAQSGAPAQSGGSGAVQQNRQARQPVDLNSAARPGSPAAAPQ